MIYYSRDILNTNKLTVALIFVDFSPFYRMHEVLSSVGMGKRSVKSEIR